MDQHFDSEESISGCESGWTLYLQHDSIPLDVFSWKQASHDAHEEDNDDEEEEEDDDDMSMVSDASSGPPHIKTNQEHEEDEYYNNENGVFCDPTLTLVARKRRKLFKQTSFHSHRHMQDFAAASLDDTASSPFFSFSSKDLQVCKKQSIKEDDNSFCYSHGHSTTYFEMV